MFLAKLAVSVVLTFGPAGTRLERVTADPWVEVRVPLERAFPFIGITLPGVILLDPNWQGELPHELGHTLQWNGLGLAFPLAYVATLGRSFEDYRQPDPWLPEPGGPTCPLLSYAPEEGAFFLRCWR